MKTFHWFAVAAVALVGCAAHDHEHEHEHEEHEAVSYYHEHEGLKLPEEVRQHLSVQFVTVGHDLLVPNAAIINAADDRYVYVQKGDYLAGTRVVTGVSSNGWTHITAGVSPQDRVVSRGAMDLRMVELLAIRGGSACGH